MHVVTLIRTDPVVVSNLVVVEIGLELAEVYDIRHPRRIGRNILVAYERIMLALVQLCAVGTVTTSVIEFVIFVSPVIVVGFATPETQSFRLCM